MQKAINYDQGLFPKDRCMGAVQKLLFFKRAVQKKRFITTKPPRLNALRASSLSYSTGQAKFTKKTRDKKKVFFISRSDGKFKLCGMAQGNA